MSDLRTRLLHFLDEQEAMCKSARSGPWSWYGSMLWNESADNVVLNHGEAAWFVAERDKAFIAASRTLLPLLLGAVRAICEEHREDASGCLADACRATGTGPDECAEIGRLFHALGLGVEAGEEVKA